MYSKFLKGFTLDQYMSSSHKFLFKEEDLDIDPTDEFNTPVEALLNYWNVIEPGESLSFCTDSSVISTSKSTDNTHILFTNTVKIEEEKWASFDISFYIDQEYNLHFTTLEGEDIEVSEEKAYTICSMGSYWMESCLKYFMLIEKNLYEEI